MITLKSSQLVCTFNHLCQMNKLFRFCIHTEHTNVLMCAVISRVQYLMLYKEDANFTIHKTRASLNSVVCTTCVSQRHFRTNTDTVFSIFAHSWKRLFKQRTQRINANSLQNCSAMRRTEPCYLAAQQRFSGLVGFQKNKRVF